MEITKKRLQIKQTIVTLIGEERFFLVAEEEIKRQRALLEEYIKKDPEFSLTLLPYKAKPFAPEIAHHMSEASAKVGVGPMAAVAGAIAEYALKAMLKAGARHAIVDNGGDIAMFIDRPVTVGVYTGDAEISTFGLKFYPEGKIIGICTSSARIGHSLSFGIIDASVVIAEDVALADAAATALGNAVVRKDKAHVERAISTILIDEIRAALVVVEDLIGFGGDLPELVKAEVDFELITKG